ncbi:hypothetical protein ACFQZV_12620 [Microbacterium koreense]|uniref:DUF559 domain-containing protein n=1 Tax=Microbacterium koreense TaxID=323761 RepID=A0ABW2ZU54_9MICO
MQIYRRLTPLPDTSWLTVHDLTDRGFTRHGIADAVAKGRLIRLRRGRYTGADLDPRLCEAGRLGGRLDCVSLLGLLGVFVRHPGPLHLQFEHGTTRLPPRPPGTVAHWRACGRSSQALATHPVSALIQACRCQAEEDAVASLDSAVNLGVLDEAQLNEVFAALLRRLRRLRHLVDGRSESGPETIVRLILRSLGALVDVQVVITGVGRVDLLVDGWLIIECDSRAHHEGWDQQRRDRRRDLAAARLGYSTIRPIAEDILYRTAAIRDVLAEILAQGQVTGRLRNSTDAVPNRRRAVSRHR